MEKRELTIEDLKNFANELILLHNSRYPSQRISKIDPASHVGIFEIGATVGKIAGKLDMHMGQSYGINDLSIKMGEIKRRLEKKTW